MAFTYSTKATTTALLATNPVVISAVTPATGDNLLVLGIFTGGTTARAGTVPTFNGSAFTSVSIAIASAEVNCELWYKIGALVTTASTITIPNTGLLSLRAESCTFKAAQTPALFGIAVGSSFVSIPSLVVNSVPAGAAAVFILGSGTAGIASVASHTVWYQYDEGNWVNDSEYTIAASSGNLTMSFTKAAADDAARIMAVWTETAPPIQLSGLIQVTTSCSGGELKSTYIYFQGVTQTATTTIGSINITVFLFLVGLSEGSSNVVINLNITRNLSADSYTTTGVSGELTVTTGGIFFEGIIYSISGANTNLVIERNLSGIVVDISFIEESLSVTRNITTESFVITGATGNLSISMYLTGIIGNQVSVYGNISIGDGYIPSKGHFCFQSNTMMVLGVF